MPAAPPPALADIQEEQVTLLTGAQPTESALREHLSRAAVAHIALPFRVNVASPLFSPLLTAGELRADAPDSSEDGALELREIINLEVPAAIVVLTDGAALSMREAADDAALVHWAWQAAGVRTVMMPRWSGDAAVADRLLAAFHETRRKGRDAAASLPAAQSAIRRTDETASPYDWAGWILFSGR